jgi:RecJ-like exonuclease
MTRCGRCYGRGYIQRIRGVGHDDCPVCKGTGVKAQTSSLGRGKARLLSPSGTCLICGNAALDWHHVCPQSRIQRFVLDAERKAALEDRRNLIPVCRDCHERIERAVLHVEPHQLPVGFWDFIQQYDLFVALPRHLACGAAVDSNPGTVGSSTLRPSREVPR